MYNHWYTYSSMHKSSYYYSINSTQSIVLKLNNRHSASNHTCRPNCTSIRMGPTVSLNIAEDKSTQYFP